MHPVERLKLVGGGAYPADCAMIYYGPAGELQSSDLTRYFNDWAAEPNETKCSGDAARLL
jgi:hypothetical protein